MTTLQCVHPNLAMQTSFSLSPQQYDVACKQISGRRRKHQKILKFGMSPQQLQCKDRAMRAIEVLHSRMEDILTIPARLIGAAKV